MRITKAFFLVAALALGCASTPLAQAKAVSGEGHEMNKGAAVYIGPKAVKKIQRALRQEGYYKGPISGVMGERTTAAVRKFQKAEGLRPTGKLNVKTLVQLKRTAGVGGPEYRTRPGKKELMRERRMYHKHGYTPRHHRYHHYRHHPRMHSRYHHYRHHPRAHHRYHHYRHRPGMMPQHRYHHYRYHRGMTPHHRYHHSRHHRGMTPHHRYHHYKYHKRYHHKLRRHHKTM